MKLKIMLKIKLKQYNIFKQNNKKINNKKNKLMKLIIN